MLHSFTEFKSPSSYSEELKLVNKLTIWSQKSCHNQKGIGEDRSIWQAVVIPTFSKEAKVNFRTGKWISEVCSRELLEQSFQLTNWNIINSYKSVRNLSDPGSVRSLVHLYFLQAFRKSLIISLLMSLRNECWLVAGQMTLKLLNKWVCTRGMINQR